jgi:hypothetical protein
MRRSGVVDIRGDGVGLIFHTTLPTKTPFKQTHLRMVKKRLGEMHYCTAPWLLLNVTYAASFSKSVLVMD